MDSLQRLLAPDKISIDEDMALVTVVGKGMRSVSGSLPGSLQRLATHT